MRHAVHAHHFAHHKVVALLWPGQWGLRAIDRGPLLGERREDLLLAGDAFDSDRVDVDEVQSRKESLGTPRVRSSVFRQQGFAEALFGRNIADDGRMAEGHDASVGQRDVALEPPEVEYLSGAIDFKANARVEF